MVVWSAVRPLLAGPASKTLMSSVMRRGMSEHRVFPLEPSRWQWKKFKDLFHFYTLLGVLPLTAIVTLTNVFVGPATLSEIPEDYTPKYWEYYRNPITRFMAKYILSSPQQEYEKFLHVLFEEDEMRRIRVLEEEIKRKMQERQDYQAYYYKPIFGKFYRMGRDSAEYINTLRAE